MPLYRPSELSAFLKSEGLRPLQSLSQNFLIDGNVVAKIAQIAGIKRGEPILEIGPGPGVLTEHLRSLDCPVLAIEKDRRFAKLIERFDGVIGIHGDALKIDLCSLVRAHFPKTESIRVLSNLPYRFASAFLRRLLPAGKWIKSLTLMLPFEVFDKLRELHPPHWSHIALQLFCHQTTFLKVRKGCFYPTPACASILVHWELATLLSEEDGWAFLHWLVAMLSSRQRALRAKLRALDPTSKAQDFLKTSRTWPPTFPLELSPREWLELWQIVR